jgi:hypothetical protein
MVSDLKQNWKYLSGDGNLFVLSYESSAMIRADATTPPAPISVSYLCVFRMNNGKIEEVWMNGGPATPPATESKKE